MASSGSGTTSNRSGPLPLAGFELPAEGNVSKRCVYRISRNLTEPRWFLSVLALVTNDQRNIAVQSIHIRRVQDTELYVNTAVRIYGKSLFDRRSSRNP